MAFIISAKMLVSPVLHFNGKKKKKKKKKINSQNIGDDDLIMVPRILTLLNVPTHQLWSRPDHTGYILSTSSQMGI